MNLIIGNNSQISHFMPDDYVRISSRNIDFNFIKKNKWSKIFICFSEQRTFNSYLSENDFLKVNVDLTSDVIDKINRYTDCVVCYGTAELWNNHNGPINIHSPIDYKYSPYVKSKHIFYEKISDKRSKSEWQNVILIHPFNFNSLKRREGFLFERIFSALLNNQPTKVGNLDINRDLIHINYLVKNSIDAYSDMIVGSGKLTNVKKFTKSLFSHFNKNFDDLLIEDISTYSSHLGNSFWLDTDIIYDELLNDTILEISEFIKK